MRSAVCCDSNAITRASYPHNGLEAQFFGGENVMQPDRADMFCIVHPAPQALPALHN